jgi:branched-chain amino acid transport system substrate-binding protein
LFLRQSRELGLHWKALIGHGAGYGVPDKLYETFGSDSDYIFNVDPVSIWLVKPDLLKPGLGKITQMVGEKYKEAEPDVKAFSAHVGMAASNSYLFFSDVLPRAIKEYGGIDADALRQAALDTDIPVGGTLMGFGVKFEPPDGDMAGQNDRASPVVVQYIKGEPHLVWPMELQSMEPVLPLPSSSPYAE